MRPHAYSYSYSYDSYDSYDCVGVGVHVEVDSGDKMAGVEDETEKEDWNS